MALSLIPFAAKAQGPAPLVGKHLQTMSYDIYAGGINAVEAELTLDVRPEENYELELKAKTQGFLASLVPWHGSFMTKGWRDERPKLHQSVSTWRDETEVKKFNYSPDGRFLGLEITEEGQDRSPRNLDDELTQGTVDAMTAALKVMKLVAAGQECKGESEVFDGKRRFKMVFNHDKDEQLERSRYNIYEGTAARCSIEVQPVAGAWHKKPRGWLSIQEQGRNKGSLPTIWLAQIDENGPAVPVKLRLKTDYGTLFMHLTGYEGQDKKLAQLDD